MNVDLLHRRCAASTIISINQRSTRPVASYHHLTTTGVDSLRFCFCRSTSETSSYIIEGTDTRPQRGLVINVHIKQSALKLLPRRWTFLRYNDKKLASRRLSTSMLTTTVHRNPQRKFSSAPLDLAMAGKALYYRFNQVEMTMDL